jgi:hypothetical protein
VTVGTGLLRRSFKMAAEAASALVDPPISESTDQPTPQSTNEREEKTPMSDTPKNESRRDAVKVILAGLAAVPVVNLVGLSVARASDLPHVDEATDPTAIALKYKHDATQADRAAAARPGLPPEEQICANCQFVLGEGDWVGCTLFPGKAVAAQGWCMSWAPKPAA